MTTTSEDARKYLEDMLPLGQWRAASYAIGRDHAYLQQYIRNGKPRWLSEPDRNALVELYGLDADRLRPPLRIAQFPEHTGRHRRDQPRLDAKAIHEIESDPCLLQVVLSWPWLIDDADRRRATNAVLALAAKGRTAPPIVGQRLDADAPQGISNNKTVAVSK